MCLVIEEAVLALCGLSLSVTVRRMYAATAVSDGGQLQGAVTRGSYEGQFPRAAP
jgi:hypothetical protein